MLLACCFCTRLTAWYRDEMHLRTTTMRSVRNCARPSWQTSETKHRPAAHRKFRIWQPLGLESDLLFLPQWHKKCNLKHVAFFTTQWAGKECDQLTPIFYMGMGRPVVFAFALAAASCHRIMTIPTGLCSSQEYAERQIGTVGYPIIMVVCICLFSHLSWVAFLHWSLVGLSHL